MGVTAEAQLSGKHLAWCIIATQLSDAISSVAVGQLLICAQVVAEMISACHICVLEELEQVECMRPLFVLLATDHEL